MKKFLYLHIVLGIFLVILFTINQSLSPSENHNIAGINVSFTYDLPQPNPDLSPQEVVEIQILALKENDQPFTDYGVKSAFNFASPSFKSKAGSEYSFIEMIHNQTYNSLIGYKLYGLDDVYIINNLALQKVTLIDANDAPAVYLFKLIKQTDTPFIGCWMIDSVIRF